MHVQKYQGISLNINQRTCLFMFYVSVQCMPWLRNPLKGRTSSKLPCQRQQAKVICFGCKPIKHASSNVNFTKAQNNTVTTPHLRKSERMVGDRKEKSFACSKWLCMQNWSRYVAHLTLSSMTILLLYSLSQNQACTTTLSYKLTC